VVQARREAMAADLVVVNHHLFFADMALRDSGVAELLPTVDAAVFDEAHQLVDAGVQFLGQTLGTAQTLELARDLLAVGNAQARGLAPWHELAAAVEKGARDLRLALAGELRDVRGLRKLRWDERPTARDWPCRCRRSGSGTDAGRRGPGRHGGDRPRLRAPAAARAGDRRAGRRFHRAAGRRSRALDRPVAAAGAAGGVAAGHPRDAGRTAGRHAAAWIFTSATLGDDDALTWFTRQTALEDAATLRVQSPFDYAGHARLWVPARFPKPNETGHPAAVGALAARCAHALHGRTFVLTTTLRALEIVAAALRPRPT
jgi:ATP-dependent DNA helicase DinG